MRNTSKPRANKATKAATVAAQAEQAAAQAAFLPAIAAQAPEAITPDAADIFQPGESDTFQQAEQAAPEAEQAAAQSKQAAAQAAARVHPAFAAYLATLNYCGAETNGKRLPVKPVPIKRGVLRGSDFTARSAGTLIAAAVASGLRIEPGSRISLRLAESLFIETGAAHDSASRYSCAIDYAGADSAIVCGTQTRNLLLRGLRESFLAEHSC